MSISSTPSDDFCLLDNSTAQPASDDSLDNLSKPASSVLSSDKKGDEPGVMASQEMELDSLYPVIYQLPNTVQLADNSLRILGAVSKADLESFSSFTRRVGSFILTDPPLHLHGCTISPGAYIRLARIQSPQIPFFPSLKRLRIVDADASLDTQLNFLLADSLQSVELVNLADFNHEVFSSFLITLADECPRLSSISLGQDQGRHLPLSLLDDCLKFTHLRELELKNVLSSFDFQLLVTIGKALPELESFILNARTAKYSFNGDPIQPEAEEYPTDGRAPHQGLPQEWDQFTRAVECPSRQSVMESSLISGSGSCPSPRVRDFTRCPSPAPSSEGYLSPVDAEHRAPVASPQLKPASLPLTEEDECPPSSRAGTVQEPSIFPPSFLRLRRLHVTGELALIKDLVRYVGSTALENLALTLVRSLRPKIVVSWKEVQIVKYVRKKPRTSISMVRTGDTVVDLETPLFVSIVEEAVHATWKDTLTKLYLGQHETYPPAGFTENPASPTLQFSCIAKVLSRSTLELLEISGWKLDSLSIPVSELSPKLKVLHLPVGLENKGISLSDLRRLAESCPSIVSFQSNIIDLQSIPVYPPHEGASDALSHGLEILSVGNASENPNPKDVLNVARHLFILFPYLKEIRTHEGQNKEQWMYIHSLVQLLQTGLLDDAARMK